ncbi:conserved protein implicated in secretion [Cenarchaeum symbiosum A]|uniref:Conserved protein implicated in secretion n=1 Tax=Cenarchaeum symbiosum (strain A) TaxID=414004 RepID=A0RYS7_CENSY|nr:conserved protein implicated in secretion [Cenarchaeum symbiosum A]
MFRPQGPLKPRVQTAITRLRKQITKLDGMLVKLNDRDEKLFARIVAATQQHDAHAGKVLSNELAEVRKVKKVLGNARISLERIEMRLSTCSDLGDTVMAMMPTMGIMNGMKSSLAKFMPGADQEIGRMSEMLDGLMGDSFSGDGAFGMDVQANEETEKIMAEAAAVAETSVDTKFPQMPQDLDQKSSESSSARFM